ncbi:MAG: histone deacetylase family protein [Acidimicrobiales bacterium]
MGVLLLAHDRCLDHDAGRGHPERPDRLRAVARGIEEAGLSGAAVAAAPRAATRAELERVHPAAYLDAIERFCRSGGGHLDPDTGAGPASWDAAVLAAGAGPSAIERLDAGEADAAFLAVRPPGHHATGSRAMGFCLLNNVAVAAAALADRGERVAIVDYDAHHGNGTQEVFYEDPRVLYVSLHQWPLYPGTGRLEEAGAGAGEGTTLNLPMRPETTGDAYRAAVDEVVVPVVEAFRPTWLVLSAGFDGHRADPLTDLRLSAGDFADLTDRLAGLVPAGRRLAFLEGGYDLDALAASSGACVAALAGVRWRPEPASSGGPDAPVVAEAARRLAARPAPA